MTSFNQVALTITLTSQYHIGSGYGLARVIDSLLRLDADGIPVIPGTTVSGIVGQGFYDLLDFKFFEEKQEYVCDFHKPDSQKPRLPCALREDRKESPCLFCYFMGSSAEEGIINWEDFVCVNESNLLIPMLKSKEYTADERKQYIRPYASHKQNMRTKTVMEKHFFVREEGAALDFEGTLSFKEPVEESMAVYLAAALANVRSVGQRKTRGKGKCRFDGIFFDTSNNVQSKMDELVKKI